MSAEIGLEGTDAVHQAEGSQHAAEGPQNHGVGPQSTFGVAGLGDIGEVAQIGGRRDWDDFYIGS